MANTVITHPAQKLTIKSMRGSHFKLVINVKDNGGSNYDFTPTAALTDTAFIDIYRRDGFVLENSNGSTESIATDDDGNLQGGTALHSNIDASVEDGKLTFEWDTSIASYAPWPGKYKYHIYTENSDTTAKTIWLYGDFVVIDNNTYVGIGFEQVSN